MRTFVMGDIHGAHRALLQCLERSNFDKEKDKLILLGDVVDGWSEVYECVEELLTIKNLVVIRGNHDRWFQTWIETGEHPANWLQGGEGTLKSYGKLLDNFEIIPSMRDGWLTTLLLKDIPESHVLFFLNALNYYYDEKRDYFFVHGGFNRHLLIKDQEEHVLYWDRDLWLSALSYKEVEKNRKEFKFRVKENFEEIYIGHTSTINWKNPKTKEPMTEPMKAANIYNLDTGAGYNGKLTILDIDSKEFFQSDLVRLLYSEEDGRN